MQHYNCFMWPLKCNRNCFNHNKLSRLLNVMPKGQGSARFSMEDNILTREHLKHSIFYIFKGSGWIKYYPLDYLTIMINC